jgi:hypothetical protein
MKADQVGEEHRDVLRDSHLPPPARSAGGGPVPDGGADLSTGKLVG